MVQHCSVLEPQKDICCEPPTLRKKELIRLDLLLFAEIHEARLPGLMEEAGRGLVAWSCCRMREVDLIGLRVAAFGLFAADLYRNEFLKQVFRRL